MMPRGEVVPLRDDAPVLLPPVAAEAEQALLGAILINNAAYNRVCDFLLPEHFGHEVHGRLYAAAGKLIERGQPADLVTLRALADQDAALIERGGVRYLAQLVEHAVTILNAEHYGRAIHDAHLRRELIALGQQAMAAAYEQDLDDPPAAQIERVEQRLYDLATTGQTRPAQHISAIAADVVADTQEAYKRGGAIVVDTGLIDLDRILAGMSPGDLVIVAGRPSMGKTALACTIAENCASAGKVAAVFSLEMTGRALVQRWIAGRTGISTERQRHGRLSGDEWDAMLRATQEIGELPIHIDDQPRLSVAQMRQRARRIKRRHGLDIVIIDQLSHVRSTTPPGKLPRYLEVGEITKGLKHVAKELGVPVLLLHQLGRDVEKREDKRPMLSDLRESGDVEQDADTVMFLYREEYYLSRSAPTRRAQETGEAFATRLAEYDDRLREVRSLAEISVAKMRQGKIGVARVVFDGERQRFENLARG